MKFRKVPNGSRIPTSGRDIGYLWEDKWNDWYKYRTLFFLTYYDDSGESHDFGAVKIGQFDLGEGQMSPDLPEEFENLDPRFFSLGQDVDYYTKATEVFELTMVKRFFESLRDIAADHELYQRALRENVTGDSLLRFVSSRTVLITYEAHLVS